MCLSMDCDETLHVESIHSKVCLCIIEFAFAMVTKSGCVEKGDNLVNTSQSFFTHIHTKKRKKKKRTKNRLVHLTWLRRYF